MPTWTSISGLLSTASISQTIAQTLTRLAIDGVAMSLVVFALGVLLVPARGWLLRLSARLRFRLLVGIFASVFLIPLCVVLLPHSSAPSVGEASVASQSVLHLSSCAALLLAALWLALSACFALRLAAEFLRLHRLVQTAKPTQPTQPSAIAGLRIASTNQIDSPCLVGIIHPVILIPASLCEQLSPAQFAAVLDHETAHLTRRDPWTNLFQKLALILFPLSPALHLLDRLLSRERELACDEAVLRSAHAAADYAATLVDIAAFTLKPAAVSLAFGAVRSRSELSVRVERIVRPLPRLHPAMATLLVAVIAVSSATLTSAALHHLPAIAFASPEQTASLAAPAAPQPPGIVETAYRLPRRRSTPPRPRMIQTAWHRPGRQHPQHSMTGLRETDVSETRLRAAMPGAVLSEAAMPETAMQIAATQLSSRPMLASAEPASADDSVVLVMTSVTTTSVSTSRAEQPARIYFTIVTTTLRLTPGERARLAPEWFARQL